MAADVDALKRYIAERCGPGTPTTSR